MDTVPPDDPGTQEPPRGRRDMDVQLDASDRDAAALTVTIRARVPYGEVRRTLTDIAAAAHVAPPAFTDWFPGRNRGGHFKLAPAERDDYARRACALVRGGATWREAGANLYVPGSTLWRWHSKLLACSSHGTG